MIQNFKNWSLNQYFKEFTNEIFNSRINFKFNEIEFDALTVLFASFKIFKNVTKLKNKSKMINNLKICFKINISRNLQMKHWFKTRN